ncbi:hypothetical protein ACQKML_05630 [Peribacillus frigoritolerans]
MKSKKDTWSVSSNQAQGVAQGANTLGKPYADWIRKIINQEKVIIGIGTLIKKRQMLMLFMGDLLNNGGVL